jgi:hypothetical protein
MTIINKTPHQITIYDEQQNIIRTYPASDSLIHLEQETVPCGTLEDGTPLTRAIYGKAEGLPDYQEGKYYIVSPLVKTAFPDRMDLLVPAELLRGEDGNIIGCKSLGV